MLVTKSGHKVILVSPNNATLNNVVTGINTNKTLLEKGRNKLKTDIDLKLQFSNLSPDKLIKLVNSADDPWQRDEEC